MTLENEAAVKAWLVESLGSDALALDRLARLVDELRTENARQNLVSAGSLEWVWQRHIADSAQLLLHVPRETRAPNWLDLGTGAGFPGLVIAICRQDIEMTLVENRSMRVAWLTRTIENLELANVRVVGQRLETIPTRTFAVISARAFAPLKQLVALAARFSTSETLWLLPKGRSARKELADMPLAIQTMFHVERSVTDDESAILVGQGRPPSGKRARP